ncbi:MAG: thioredoxin domain-containing protein [Bdellovibrionia bacterium]
MNKTKGIWVLLAAVAIICAALFQFRPKSGNSERNYAIEPVKFVYRANGPPGAAAIIHGKTISEQELEQRSAVLSDLYYQECKFLAEAAAARVSKRGVKVRLDLFATDTNGELRVKLDKLKLPLIINFSAESHSEGVARLDGKPLSRDELSFNQVQYSLLKTRQFKEKLTILRDLFVNLLQFDSAKAKDAKPNFDEKGEIFFSPPSYAFPVNGNKLLIENENPGAKTVLVFSSLQCSVCSELARDLNVLKAKYGKQIRIGFANFFSAEDWRSQLAAESAFCLNAQKHEYFLSFLESIAGISKPADESVINATVKKTGADYEMFRSCLLKKRYKEEVSDQLKYAADFGVLTMPTVIVGGQVFAGTVRPAELEQALAEY